MGNSTKKKKMPGKTWFGILVSITVLTFIIYLVCHCFQSPNAKEIKYLNADQLAVINGIIDNTNTTSLSDSTRKKQRILEFIKKVDPEILPEDSGELSEFIQASSYAELRLQLPKYPIFTRSFFHLYGNGVYFEIIWWSLFGVLANLVYSTSEYLRKKEFMKEELFAQLAKLTYTPLSVIVIYLSYNSLNPAANTGGSIVYTNYTIVISFLLGFFSGRMIELLNKIKNILIPITDQPATDEVTTDTATDDVPEDIINEAIRKHADEWKTKYNVEAVGIGKKRQNGIMKDINCITFVPEKKVDDAQLLPAVKIPDTIKYEANNGETYTITTDVEASGSKIKATSMLTCAEMNPKRPGCSISRPNSEATGTIGLLVYKDKKPYILGCYHVLCAPELASKQVEVTDALNGNKHLISPGSADGGNVDTPSIATVENGIFTDTIDAAIAAVADASLLTDRICLIGRNATTPLSITLDHVNAQYPVTSIGRTTSRQDGFITSSNINCSIGYDVNGRSFTHDMTGLIRITNNTDGGDSGGPVIDAKNNIIGLVVASSDNDTYIMPIGRLLDQFKISLT
jgi:hypothetical protein